MNAWYPLRFRAHVHRRRNSIVAHGVLAASSVGRYRFRPGRRRAAAPTAAPPGAYTIYKELPCKCYNGQTAIAYRVGYYVPPDTGFGHKKVLLKHNMYTPVVAFIVKGPHNSHTNGTGGEAYAYAYHFVDGVLKQQIKIWAKYDTRKLRDNHSFGIVTAFCNGSTVCPQWVNQAINAQALPTSAASSAQPDGTRLGYSSRTS